MTRPRLPPEALRVRLDLTLPQGLVEFLGQLAAEGGCSRSEVVVKWLEAERRKRERR